MILSNKIADNHPYTFDFNAEVARARHDYPEETKDIIFVDLGVQGAEETIRTAFLESVTSKIPVLPEEPDTPLKTLYRQTLQHQTEKAADTHIAHGNCAYRVDITSQKKVLQLKIASSEAVIGRTKDVEAFFLFSHELGHLVVKDACPEASNTPETIDKRNMEIKADVFSALYGLKHGVFDENDIASLSLNRMWRGLLGDEEHLTSEALDHIAIREKQADFVSLDPLTIQKIAYEHGKNFNRSAKNHGSISEAFMKFCDKHPVLVEDFLDSFCEAAQQTPVNDVILSNKTLCTALATHFSSAKYKLGLCGKLEKYVAKKVRNALKG